MDMTEDNDLLLRQFFSEASQQEIADDGFSERVMERLTQLESEALHRQKLMARRECWARRVERLWTIFCIVVFAVLFVVFHGWELLVTQLEIWVRTLMAESFTINVMMLATVMFGLLFVGVGEVYVREKG
jgi:hypothetical protein